MREREEGKNLPCAPCHDDHELTHLCANCLQCGTWWACFLPTSGSTPESPTLPGPGPGHNLNFAVAAVVVTYRIRVALEEGNGLG